MSINTVPEIQIVKAAIEDAEKLTSIAYSSKKYWGYPEEWMELWREDLEISPAIIAENDSYKITSNKLTVGFIIVSKQDNCAEILHCWITPSFIGKGLGSRVLSYVFQLEKFKGTVFEVTADPNAVTFYEKFGFLEIGQYASIPLGRTLPIMIMTNA